VYQVIGIDVSKAKLDCLWFKDPETKKVKSKVWPNSPDGFTNVIAWAEKNTGCVISDIHFVMEATGVYHEALAYALHDAGARVSIVNPARMRDFAKSLGVVTKTDKKDSSVLARMGLSLALDDWKPEPKNIRILKALLGRLDALELDISREKNRLEKAEVAQVPETVIESIQTLLRTLESERERLIQEINDHIDSDPGLKKDRELLETIPAIGPVLSRTLLAILRSRPFSKASQCAAYLGVIPCQWESGSSIKGRSKLSKKGPSRVRAKLYMPAVVATRSNPDIKQQYDRLIKNGKPKMVAIGAAMRKLVQICFGVLKHQSEYRPQQA